MADDRKDKSGIIGSVRWTGLTMDWIPRLFQIIGLEFGIFVIHSPANNIFGEGLG